jgi:uncharacterized protein
VPELSSGHNREVPVPDRDQLTRALREALEPLPDVLAAFLFGSHASGRARADSDVDVAVLLDSRAAAEEPRLLTRRLIAALGTTLAADRLDLIVLNGAPPALAFQVLAHGVLVFDRKPSALHEFRTHTYSAHADYELPSASSAKSRSVAL